MSQVTEYGYETIRNFIEQSWKYIELQDSTGTAIIRLGIGDSRVKWAHVDGDGVLKLEIKITGADVALPCTVGKTAIFDTASGGNVIATADVEVTTLTQTIDELTVTANIQVPTIV